MRKIQVLIFAILLITSSPSCDFPEHFFQSEPECKSNTSNDLKKENQETLVTTLKNKAPTDYRYFFKTFEDGEYNIFLITNFRNKESCFDIKMLVDKWDKLAGMKKANGKSYPKELYDLKWEVISINGMEMVKYIDMHKIID